MTYKRPKLCLKRLLTDQVSEQSKASIRVQVEGERGGAKTDISRETSAFQSESAIKDNRNVNVGANVSEGPRVMELTTGDGIFSEARGAGV